jgi:aldose 1-epimerase
MTSSTRLPSGRQFRIAAGGWSATVTEVGAALRELRSGDRAIVDGFAETAMCTGYRGLPLLPWPNRIEDGRYPFDGVEHQLPIDRVAENNAIHGLTCWESWRLVRGTPREVRFALDLAPRPGYPFSLALEIAYALSDGGLEVTTRATNTGTGPLPFGAGHHPYFLPRTSLDAARVRVPARRSMALGARGLPAAEHPVDGTPLDLRRARPLDGLALDTCFGDLERDQDGRARIELDDITVWMDERFRWVQLYSGDKLPLAERRRSLAIEPMTCPPNALRSGRDVAVLRPDESLELRWGCEV